MSDFNIFNGMDERPIESLGAVYEAPYHEDEMPPENPSVEGASLETINPYDMNDRMNMKQALLSGKGSFMNCIADGCRDRKKPVAFIKTKCSIDGAIYWEFFLDCVQFTNLNDFVVKMSMVKPEESVMIHGPSNCCVDDAIVVISAIKRCAAKKVYISSPHILDIPSAAILIAGDNIISSVCCLIHFDIPRIGGGGAIQDAHASMKNSLDNITKLIKNLQVEGFLSEEDVNHLVNDQGSICLHGRKLAAAVDVFNQKHA